MKRTISKSFLILSLCFGSASPLMASAACPDLTGTWTCVGGWTQYFDIVKRQNGEKTEYYVTQRYPFNDKGEWKTASTTWVSPSVSMGATNKYGPRNKTEISCPDANTLRIAQYDGQVNIESFYDFNLVSEKEVVYHADSWREPGSGYLFHCTRN